MHIQHRGSSRIESPGYQPAEGGTSSNPPPFTGPQDQIDSYDHFRQRIEKREENTPSSLAKLDKEDIKSSPTIQMIDAIFDSAISEYKKTLQEACANDHQKLIIPNARDEIVDFTDAITAGVQRMIRFTPNFNVIKEISAICLSLIDTAYGILSQKNITRKKIAVENSENRQNWLNEVRILEAQRLKIARDLVVQRVAVLAQDIAENLDLVNMSAIKELTALERLYQSMNPDKPLLSEGKNVSDYIKTINADEPEEIPQKKMNKSDVKKLNHPKPPSNPKLATSNSSMRETTENKKKT